MITTKKRFVLKNQGINPTIAKSLAAYVAVSSTVTALFLGANELGVEGAKALAPAIAASSSLTELCLQRNKIGAEGAKALAPAVASSASLKTVRIARSRLRLHASERVCCLYSSLPATTTSATRARRPSEMPCASRRASSSISVSSCTESVCSISCQDGLTEVVMCKAHAHAHAHAIIGAADAIIGGWTPAVRRVASVIGRSTTVSAEQCVQYNNV